MRYQTDFGNKLFENPSHLYTVYIYIPFVYLFVCGFSHWSRSQKNYDVKGMNLILGFMGFLPEILVTLVGDLFV